MSSSRYRRSLEVTAYHEAGHAFAHCWLNVAFRKATINAGKDYLGMVVSYGLGRRLATRLSIGNLGLRDRDWAERNAMCLLAGAIAERHFTSSRSRSSSRSDREHAIDILSRMAGPKETYYYEKLLEARVEEYLLSPVKWPIVESIAAALLEHTTLDAASVRRLYNHQRAKV